MRCRLLFLCLLSACHAGPIPHAAVKVRIGTGFHTLAPAKTLADVDHFTLSLYRTPGPVLVTVHRTAGTGEAAFWLDNVPDGNFFLTAEAFETADDSVSITQGGAQTSGNTVTVLGSLATYSDAGSALTVSLSLRDATSAAALLDLTTLPGAPWTGEPVGMP